MKMIIGFIACLLFGCNQNTAIMQSNQMANMEKTIMETSNNGNEKIGPFGYSFQLGAEQYTLPVNVGGFITNGWKLDQTGNLESGKSKVVGLERGGNKVEITIQNLSPNKSMYQACETIGLSVKGSDITGDSAFTVFYGIQIGMSQKELERKINGLYYLVSYTDNGGTDYQILDDLYFKEGNGYLISTNKGLVTSININYPASGKNREERTDEVTNHWFNDPVKYVKPNTIVPIDFNCIYKADINKDGINDMLDFKFSDYNDGTLMTVVNGTVNLLRSNTSVKNAYLISRGNGSCAVLLDLDEPDNYSPCCIYQLLDARCKKCAEKKGDAAGTTLTENAVTGNIQITRGEEQDCCFLYYNGEILTDFFDKSSLIFAGSREYYKYINVAATKYMPELSFELTGGCEKLDYTSNYYFYYPVKLIIKTNKGIIQEIDFNKDDFEPCDHDDFSFEYGDYKFDGYGGFSLLHTSRSTNPDSFFWMWDKVKQQFVEYPTLNIMGYMTFDYEKKEIKVASKDGAAHSEVDTYKYINGKLKLIGTTESAKPEK